MKKQKKKQEKREKNMIIRQKPGFLILDILEKYGYSRG